MNFLVDHWYVIVLAIIAVVAIAGDVYGFIHLSPAQQKEKVQE